MAEDLQKEVAKRLKRVRKTLKATQKRMAEKFDITQATYNRYEKGEHPPSSFFLYNFCKELNINMDWIFTGDGQMFTMNPTQSFLENLDYINMKKEYDVLKEENASLKRDLVMRMAEIIDLQKKALESKD